MICLEHAFPQHSLLSGKTEGSDSEMPWFGKVDGRTPWNRMADLCWSSCSATVTQKWYLVKIWKATMLSFQCCLGQRSKKKKKRKRTNTHCSGGGNLPCPVCSWLAKNNRHYFAMFSSVCISQPAVYFVAHRNSMTRYDIWSSLMLELIIELKVELTGTHPERPMGNCSRIVA